MLGTSQIYGDYDETFTVQDAAIAIRLFSENVKMRWSQCSALADFLVTYFASRGDGTAAKGVTKAKDAIAYIMNELVENAVKFSFRGNIDASIGVQDSEIVFLVRNVITASTFSNFQAVIDEITSGNPSLILIARIEEHASAEESRKPGLGLLSNHDRLQRSARLAIRPRAAR